MGSVFDSRHHGDSLVEWHATHAKEGTHSTPEAEQIIAEARGSGYVVARRLNGELVEVLERDSFDPGAEEYRVFDPHINN